MIDDFLVGVIVAASIIAGLFFLRFWRDTGDSFFLAFGASFILEGLSRMAALFLPEPKQGSLWLYLVRLLAYLLILFAILRKNYGKSS
jgi:uncharacterized membrane protein HdeD (DUF308 family)